MQRAKKPPVARRATAGLANANSKERNNANGGLLARREAFRNKILLAMLPDTGERYLSTDLWE
jgi:hypothetical protein